MISCKRVHTPYLYCLFASGNKAEKFRSIPRIHHTFRPPSHHLPMA